jgi:hypothetical protein
VFERDEQYLLFDWAAWECKRMPELALLFCIPNGQVRRGERTEPGIRPGVPDLCLPVARGDFNALYIEMKFGKNMTTKEQDHWIEKLRYYGNRVEVCYSFEDAQQVLKDYLGYA